jgi:putative oxidoreductase
MNGMASLVGRILLSVIFILSGVEKVLGPDHTIAYMNSAAYPIPAPEIMVWVVAAIEILGGLCVLLGLFSRYAALLLAAFSVAAAILFHSNFSDQIQLIMFLKNLAMAGGLLLLYANGPGPLVLRD